VTDDQAFDAVGDVAASLGVEFRRLSYRALAGVAAATRVEEPTAEPRGRRRRRGGRRRRAGDRAGYGGAQVAHPRAAAPPRSTPVVASQPLNGGDIGEPHTAPDDVVIDVVRQLLTGSPGGVSLDALSNALKARGFSRPPGSLRLVTRVRRIKALDVNRDGIVRLGEPQVETFAERPSDVEPTSINGESTPSAAVADGAEATPRRRRRRGGRRRRKGGGGSAPADASVEG